MICWVEDWPEYSLFPFSNKQMPVNVAFLHDSYHLSVRTILFIGNIKIAEVDRAVRDGVFFLRNTEN